MLENECIRGRVFKSDRVFSIMVAGALVTLKYHVLILVSVFRDPLLISRCLCFIVSWGVGRKKDIPANAKVSLKLFSPSLTIQAVPIQPPPVSSSMLPCVHSFTCPSVSQQSLHPPPIPTPAVRQPVSTWFSPSSCPETSCAGDNWKSSQVELNSVELCHARLG